MQPEILDAEPILGVASVQDLKRMLDLYPVISLREQWPEETGTKEELCSEIARKNQSPGNLDQIVEFIDEYLCCCKQHIYVLTYKADISTLPEIILPSAEMVRQTRENNKTTLLYVIKTIYDIVLGDPLEEVKLTFLWPFRLDFVSNHLLVRFVILEKNIGTYFDNRRYYIGGRSAEEKTLLEALLKESGEGLGLKPTDIHRGVKRLWAEGIIDSSKAKYKKPKSTDYTEMDEDAGIRENYPELYETILELTMYKTLFQVKGVEDLSVEVFSVDPSGGFIHFPRYSEKKGDTDYVVERILAHN